MKPSADEYDDGSKREWQKSEEASDLLPSTFPKPSFHL